MQPIITVEELLKEVSHSRKPIFYNKEKFEKAVEIANNSIFPKHIEQKHEIGIDCTNAKPVVEVGNTLLKIESQDLAMHLSDCRECYLFCATLGRQVDLEIELAKAIDAELAYLVDFCYLCLIEKCCDLITESIEVEAKKQGKKITSRFSLGYGDTALGLQKDFLNLLDAEKRLGVQLTNGNMMLPTKTVTAFVGIIENEEII